MMLALKCLRASLYARSAPETTMFTTRSSLNHPCAGLMQHILLQLVDHSEYRQVHADDHRADDGADADYH